MFRPRSRLVGGLLWALVVGVPALGIGQIEELDAPAAEVRDAELDAELAGLRAEAEQLYAAGDLAGAANRFAELALRAPEGSERARAYVFAGWLSHLLDRQEATEEYLDSALSEDESLEIQAEMFSAEFGELFAEARERSHDRKRLAASTHLRTGRELMDRGDMDAARAAFRQALGILPEDPEALLAVARLDEAVGSRAAALDGLERLLSLIDSGQVAAEDPLLGDILAAHGELLVRERRYDEAVVSLRRAVALPGADRTAWNTLGLAHRHLDQLEEAVEAFRRAQRLAPQSSTIAGNLAEALIAGGWSRQAVSMLRPALRDDPANEALWLLLGQAQRATGDRRSALQSFRRVLDLDPDDRKGAGARAAAFLAQTHFELGDVNAAFAAASTAFKLAPESPQSLSVLGRAEKSLGYLDSARDHLESARGAAPDNPDVLNNLGGVYLALGDPWKAAELFERVVALRPESETARANLERARQLTGGQSPSASSGIRVQPRRGKDLGIRFSDVDTSALPLNGALVDQVEAGGPAARAGLRRGDLILRIDAQTVASPEDLERYLAASPSRKCQIDLLRDGRQMRLEVRF